MRRRTLLAVAFATALAARDASGDIYHLKSPSTVVTEKGNKLSLPPGYFMDEARWAALDTETKRLQAQETRLTAENKSLRASADEPSWCTMTIAGTLGLIIGAVVTVYVK